MKPATCVPGTLTKPFQSPGGLKCPFSADGDRTLPALHHMPPLPQEPPAMGEDPPPGPSAMGEDHPPPRDHLLWTRIPPVMGEDTPPPPETLGWWRWLPATASPLLARRWASHSCISQGVSVSPVRSRAAHRRPPGAAGTVPRALPAPSPPASSSACPRPRRPPLHVPGRYAKVTVPPQICSEGGGAQRRREHARKPPLILRHSPEVTSGQAPAMRRRPPLTTPRR